MWLRNPLPLRAYTIMPLHAAEPPFAKLLPPVVTCLSNDHDYVEVEERHMIKKILKNSERGQAIILIAFAIIGMIAIVGLMTDGGMLLIEYARLKRGIDAASVAAALQFRKGLLKADLEKAAEEFLKLNQSDVTNVHIDSLHTSPRPTRSYAQTPHANWCALRHHAW